MKKSQKNTILYHFSSFFEILPDKQGLSKIDVLKVPKSIIPVYKRWMTKNVKNYEKS